MERRRNIRRYGRGYVRTEFQTEFQSNVVSRYVFNTNVEMVKHKDIDVLVHF